MKTKRIIAIIMSAALIISLAACSSNTSIGEDPEIQGKVEAICEKLDEAVSNLEQQKPATQQQGENPTGEPATEAPTTAPCSTTAPSTTTPTTNPTTKPTSAPTTKPTTNPTTKPTTEPSTKPATKTQIISFFNAATKKASSSNGGFDKITQVTINKMEPSVLASIGAIKSVVEGFVGAGTRGERIEKGSGKSGALKASSLNENDVISQSITESGSNYIITLNIKGGVNPEKNNSSIGRLTDDYKSRTDIINGLNDAKNYDSKFKSFGEVTEKVDSAKAVMVVNKITKQIVQLDIEYVYSCDLKKIKYTLITADASVVATGKIRYSNFVW